MPLTLRHNVHDIHEVRQALQQILVYINGLPTVAFKTIDVSGTDAVADTATDTLILSSANAGLTIVGTDPDTITFTVVPGSGGVGDVVGPASSTDNAIVRWDGTNGKLIQNGALSGANSPTIDDSGDILLATNRFLAFRDAQALMRSNSSGTLDCETNTFTFADTSSAKILQVSRISASGVNYLVIQNAVAGSPATLPVTATGSSTDININLVPKGAGVLQVSANSVIAVAGAQRVLTTKGDLFVTNGTTTTRLGVGSDGQALTADAASTNGVKWNSPGSGGLGDVVGPASSVDNVVAIFDGTTGKLLESPTNGPKVINGNLNIDPGDVGKTVTFGSAETEILFGGAGTLGLTALTEVQLRDTSLREILRASTVGAGAVNEVSISNAITANGPTISSTGSDTDIDLLLVAKGTGVVKADGVEVVTLTGSQVLTNKTLTAPTIADFTNANHDHLDADDGGVLTLPAVGIANSSTVGQVLRVTGASTYAFGAVDLADSDAVTGVLPVGNGGTGNTTGTATLVTIANEATDTSCFITFVTAATGDLGLKSNANLAYDSNAGSITVGSTGRIYFRDSGLYIYSSVDGQLDVAADTLLSLGVAGDTTLGDSTGRYFYPQTNGKIALYDSGETKGFTGIRYWGDAAVSASMLRHSTSNTAGNNLTVAAGGATSAASNKSGGDLVLAPGVSTGTGKGAVRIQGLGRLAGTTTDNSLVDRLLVPATVALSDSATDLFDLTVAASEAAGGMVVWSIEAKDATNTQCLSGITTFSVVRNSSGTFTTAITNDTANDAKAVSSGTITTSWTINTTGSTATIRVTPTGSLSETIYRITFTIFNLSFAAVTQK